MGEKNRQQQKKNRNKIDVPAGKSLSASDIIPVILKVQPKIRKIDFEGRRRWWVWIRYVFEI